MPSKDRSEARIRIGRLGYFIQRGRTTGTRSAVYFGPSKSSDGAHRHVTAIFDTDSGDLENVHLTKEGLGNRSKKWSIDPNRVRPDVVRWIRDNSQPIDRLTLKLMDEQYYSVSAWRLHAGFRVLSGFASMAFWLLARPMAKFGIVRMLVEEDPESGNFIAEGSIDIDRLMAVFQKLRPFKGIAQVILAAPLRRAMPRLLKLSLKGINGMSPGDAALLIPRRAGLPAVVVVRWTRHMQLDAAKVFEKAAALYKGMELAEFIPNTKDILLPNSSVPFRLESRSRP